MKARSDEKGIQVRSSPGVSISEVHGVFSNSTLPSASEGTRGGNNRQCALRALGNNSKEGFVFLLLGFCWVVWAPGGSSVIPDEKDSIKILLSVYFYT